MSLIAGAMVASAVATTAWNMGRADTAPQDLAAPAVVTAPASAAVSHPAAQRRAAATSTTGTSARGRALAADTHPVSPSATPAAPPPTAARDEPAPARTKPASTRSPKPEAQPYGPWECSQGLAVDWQTKTGVVAKPCRMTGRDIRYQGSLTAPGAGTGRITVELQDSTTGRTVDGPKTCDNLTFEGRVNTQNCGPEAAKPARGHSYAVVVSFSYERSGQTLTSRAKGPTFTW